MARRKANIKFATMREVFAPIAALLLVKFMDMELCNEEADKFEKYMQEPRKVSFEAWCEEGDIREQKLKDAAFKTRAFASKGAEQWELCRAADYCDEWLRSANTSFRAYYVCRSGGGHFRPLKTCAGRSCSVSFGTA